MDGAFFGEKARGEGRVAKSLWPCRVVPGRRVVQGVQPFEDVVHVGQRQGRVARLLPLAVRVELLGKGADAGSLGFGGRGEGEFLEARGFT